jgi:hypothetical protein
MPDPSIKEIPLFVPAEEFSQHPHLIKGDDKSDFGPSGSSNFVPALSGFIHRHLVTTAIQVAPTPWLLSEIIIPLWMKRTVSLFLFIIIFSRPWT